MGETSMSIDRKATNGPGSRRIESGGGDLSTTVQASKHTASFLSALTDKYSGRSGMDAQARTDVSQYAQANVRELRSLSKEARKHSKKTTPSTKSSTPVSRPSLGASTAHETFLTTTADKFKKGGEKIKG